MVNFGIMLALLLGTGVLLVLRSKSSPSIRRVGYMLVVMTLFLVCFAVLAYLNPSHYE